MTHAKALEEIAAQLFAAEKERKSVSRFVDAYPELDEALAYRVQERLVEMKCEAEKTHRVGWKLGLTSKAKQKMIGVHEPSYGILLESMQLFEGEPVSVAPFIHAKAEPEIAFIFDKDENGPGATVTDVLAATAYIAPAIEIIDSRFHGFQFTLPDAVADNSSSSRFIIGERFIKPDAVDLRLMGMVFKKNGEVISTGAGAAVMGHPARAIAWMVNKLSKVEQGIKAGDIVLAGAMSGAEVIKAGDHFSAAFDGMGSVEIFFKE